MSSDHIPEERSLIDDRRVAELVCLSRSWVRQQRLRRRRGLPHAFTIDPVIIGSIPRYPLDEVYEWIRNLRDLGRRR